MKKIILLLILIWMGEIMGKPLDDKTALDMRVKYEVELKSLHPEEYLELTQDPQWDTWTNEDKIVELIARVVEAGQKDYDAVNPWPTKGAVAGAPVTNDPFTFDWDAWAKRHKNVPLHLSQSQSDYYGRTNHPGVAGVTNQATLDYQKSLNEDIGRYNQDNMAYVAEMNRRINEQNNMARYQNAKGWGMVPGVFPEAYEQVAKSYTDSGGVLNPRSGLSSFAMPEQMPVAPLKYERPFDAKDPMYAGDVVSTRSSVKGGIGSAGGGRGTAAKYGVWKPTVYDPSDATGTRMHEHADDWASFTNALWSAQYNNMNMLTTILDTNFSKMFKVSELKKSGTIKDLEKFVGEEMVVNPANELNKYYGFDQNTAHLWGDGKAIGSWAKGTDAAGKTVYFYQFNPQAMTALTQTVKPYVEQNYNALKKVFRSSATKGTDAVDYAGSKDNIMSNMAELLAIYLMTSRTSMPELDVKNTELNKWKDSKGNPLPNIWRNVSQYE